jgi:phospholipid transport system substrate-binding protein
MMGHERRARATGARARHVARGGVFATAAWLAALGATGVSPAYAQTTPQSPVDVLRTRNQAVTDVLDAAGDSVDAPTRERLKDVINDLIDFQELSRRALSRHWDARTDQEKTDFADVFRRLIRNSSVKKLGVYRADSVTYRPPEASDKGVTVTTLAFKDGKSAEIVYEMHEVGGEWKAYDVVVDGSSTVRTYRDSFNKEISRTSYSTMYAKLLDRLKEDS